MVCTMVYIATLELKVLCYNILTRRFDFGYLNAEISLCFIFRVVLLFHINYKVNGKGFFESFSVINSEDTLNISLNA